ncbi:MAG: TolC family protein [Planctomycetota bacterium]
MKRQPAAAVKPAPATSTRRRAFVAALIGAITVAPGCSGFHSGSGLFGSGLFGPGPNDTRVSYHDNVGLSIEYPEAASCPTPASTAAAGSVAPLALRDPSEIPALDLTLEEAVRMAVAQSPVIRSLGGSVVSAPAATQTAFDPAGTAANPLTGTEGALAAFDANWNQQLNWSNVDQPTNRLPFEIPGVNGGPPLIFAPFVQSRGATFINELSKPTATGATFAIRQNVQYNKTLDPSVLQQRFQSAFTGFVEAEYRQPLLRGAGTTFNRIAGPNAPVGQYNGVLIARVNEDVSLADFEASVVSLVADVEQAYWDLARSYRVLDATVKGRRAAEKTYRFEKVRLEAEVGRADEEAQARSQYYQFQAQVDSALGGEQGLYALEQRLRYLIGMPASDGRLIRPSTDPTDIKVVIDWDSALGQALVRRVEIRRQQLNLKRRQLELAAAKLGRKPQLDFLAQYRWRGLGDRLIGSQNDDLDNLVGTITGGDFQEAQAGIEFNMPVGLRQASLAVTSAKLNVKREQAILSETELRISHDLASAARQIELSYRLVETNFSRYQADLKQVEVLEQRYKVGTEPINFLLQAQRQLVQSESAFYQALYDYNLAIRNFHREKGSLLAYNQVQMSEAAWEGQANADAYQVGRFLHPRSHADKVVAPQPISRRSFNPSEIQPTVMPFENSGMLNGDFYPTSPDPATDNSADSDAEADDSDTQVDAELTDGMDLSQEDS